MARASLWMAIAAGQSRHGDPGRTLVQARSGGAGRRIPPGPTITSVARYLQAGRDGEHYAAALALFVDAEGRVAEMPAPTPAASIPVPVAELNETRGRLTLLFPRIEMGANDATASADISFQSVDFLALARISLPAAADLPFYTLVGPYASFVVDCSLAVAASAGTGRFVVHSYGLRDIDKSTQARRPGTVSSTSTPRSPRRSDRIGGRRCPSRWDYFTGPDRRKAIRQTVRLFGSVVPHREPTGR